MLFQLERELLVDETIHWFVLINRESFRFLSIIVSGLRDQLSIDCSCNYTNT